MILDVLAYRKKYRGLIGIQPKLPVKDKHALSLIYTPGVAAPCKEIHKDRLKSYDYTIRGNTVAIITNGTSVYGLGDVGPLASIPMLEAKAAFLKSMAGIDAIPIALDTKSIKEFVETVRHLAPTFGAIHLEDISTPDCFAIEELCKRAVSLPIFHTDQHGTSTAVLAGLINSCKLRGGKLEDLKVVINGAGAAGIATAKLLMAAGVKEVKICDRHGLLAYRRAQGLNWIKSEIARQTNPEDLEGTLQEALVGKDVFIGLSTAGQLTPAMVQTMADRPIIFALALSEPEIPYHESRKAGAFITATGRSDFPNQINSSQVVPGIFRGALDVRATRISFSMFIAAAKALASVIDENKLHQANILPSALDFRVSAKIAKAVAQAAINDGISQIPCDPQVVEDRVLSYIYEGADAWVEPNQGGIAKEENNFDAQSLALHKRYHGVIETKAHIPIRDHFIYNLLYSAPNAALPCKMVKEDPDMAFDITCKNNLVAVVTDGSAVLGLGNIGATAGMPVMEGKAVLFKTFGGVEAFPICLRTQEVDEIVATVKRIAPVFGGINLEDIAAPRCFEVERRLTQELDIPVFHDDQHGTAVVTLAGLINSARCLGKSFKKMSVVVSGAGAAALSVSKLLLKAGLEDIIICDSKGAIHKKRKKMNPYKEEIAKITNLDQREGTMEDVLKGADIFVGLSVPEILTPKMVKTMSKDPVIFALANPVPEILPQPAKDAGAAIVATGRSDFPNQVNNSLAFPGIFRGALEVRARQINDEMKLAAAYAIAGLIEEDELDPNYVIPGPFDLRVPPEVAQAVAQAAIETKVARKELEPSKIKQQLTNYLYEDQLYDIT